MRIPFASRSYKLKSLPVSAQRLINWYPEIEPADAESQIVLHPTPGLKSFASCGTGPIRDFVQMGGVLYVVSGDKLYSVSSAGTATLLATIPSLTGKSDEYRLKISASATEIFIPGDTAGYTYDTTSGLVAVGGGYPANADISIYTDSYFVISVNAAQSFYISGVLDGSSWDALDFASAEGLPDKLLTPLVDHRELWLIGERSTEVWTNTGASAFPFERSYFMERGTAARFSPAKAMNTVFWLGDDLIVYNATGYVPTRISDHGVEQSISGYATTDDAFGWTYTTDGHVFYVLTFPTEGACWVYDAATGQWHERETYGQDRYRANCHIYAYGKHLVGDRYSGAIYELDDDTYTDAGGTIRREAVSPPIGSYDRRTTAGRLLIYFETGVGLTTGQGSDPTAILSYSDDGGRTWSNELHRSIGKIGEYDTRVEWRRLGQFYKRVYKLEVSDPVKWTVISAYQD